MDRPGRVLSLQAVLLILKIEKLAKRLPLPYQKSQGQEEK